MKLTVVRIFIVLELFAISCYSADAKRQVLVIGNDSYPAKPLKNARNDARAIADIFGGLGYTVMLELDVNHSAMENSVSMFAAGLHPGDVALFYYSGHGLQLDGENYLIPTDFKVTSPLEAKNQAISLSDIVERFAAKGATTQIIILDACRDNPFLTTRSTRGGWAGMGGSSGVFLAFGTSPGSTASDNPSEVHGLFTQALLKHLTSRADIERMFSLVREEVVRDSSGLQIPWTASSLTGEFHVVPEADFPGIKSDRRALSRIDTLPDREVASRSTLLSNTEAQDVGSFPTNSALANPSNQILINQALLLAKEQNYDEAIRSLSAALSADPKSGLALRILGLIFHLIGRTADSLVALDRAISIDPSDSRAYYYRCLAGTSADPSLAVRDCQAAVGISPNDAPTHLGLANALLLAGQAQAARSEADRTIQLAPDLPLGYAIRGQVLTRLGKYSAGEKDYQTSVRLSTTPPQ